MVCNSLLDYININNSCIYSFLGVTMKYIVEVSVPKTTEAAMIAEEIRSKVQKDIRINIKIMDENEVKNG